MNWSFVEVPFCPLPTEKQFAIVCTLNLLAPEAAILDWVVWHRIQGFDRAVLYVNEGRDFEVDLMRKLLSKATLNGSLHIVDWSWPVIFPFHDQVAGQMSCMHRARGRVKWVGLNDVDEIFVASEGRQTVREFLIEHEWVTKEYGGIVACNRWSLGDVGVANLKWWEAACDYHRSMKVIVHPDNVDYFCVHAIFSGKPGFRPYNGLSKGHYRFHHGTRRVPKGFVDMNCTKRFRDQFLNWTADMQSDR
jgi:hypothetical protein